MKKIVTGTIAFAPFLAFAQQDIGGILDIFSNLINTLLPILVALALLYFFWGLAQYVLHAGDEGAQDAARSKMIWGVIALFVMISVWGLVNVLVSTFGLDSSGPQGGIPEAPVR